MKVDVTCKKLWPPSFFIHGWWSYWESEFYSSYKLAPDWWICKCLCHMTLQKKNWTCIKLLHNLSHICWQINKNRTSHLSDCLNTDKNFLKSVITEAAAMSEQKMQLSQWVGMTSPWPKEACKSCSKYEGPVYYLFFFLIERHCSLHVCFTWPGSHSSTGMPWHALEKKYEERGQKHEQTKPGCRITRMHLQAKHTMTLVPQLPCSPDLAPADYFQSWNPPLKVTDFRS